MYFRNSSVLFDNETWLGAKGVQTHKDLQMLARIFQNGVEMEHRREAKLENGGENVLKL